jgi:hypothetical protein
VYKNIDYPVFILTHFPEAWDKYNWIQASEIHERICLNKYNFFLILAFGQVGEKKLRQRLHTRVDFVVISYIDIRSLHISIFRVIYVLIHYQILELDLNKTQSWEI